MNTQYALDTCIIKWHSSCICFYVTWKCFCFRLGRYPKCNIKTLRYTTLCPGGGLHLTDTTSSWANCVRWWTLKFVVLPLVIINVQTAGHMASFGSPFSPAFKPKCCQIGESAFVFELKSVSILKRCTIAYIRPPPRQVHMHFLFKISLKML